MSTNIQVFIPDKKSGGPYRIVYLLHGLHGNQGTWLDNTMLPYFAKEYDAVFVMPEVGRSFYADQKYGYRYFEYVSEELPRLCEKIFNISAAGEDSAVMGCSMGGYGALKLALSKPGRYGFCGAISSACIYFKHILDELRKDPEPYRKSGASQAAILQDLYSIYGDGLEWRTENDVCELAKKFPAAEKSKLKIYSVCGTEDDLREDNLRFKDEMKKLGFDFTYEEWAGGHEWIFFNEALKKALQRW